MTAFVAWTFTDPVTAAVMTFEINPDTATPTVAEKTFFTVATTAGSPDGVNNVSQGRDKPTTGSFAGKIYTQAGVTAMQTWFAKPRIITLIDDLARSSDAVLSDITFERAPRRQHPWRHTYTVNYRIMP